jgi:aryl-alcohol dehydrogenase-like predicted oxidoreductase
LAEAALNAGINYFDTAAAYNDGQSERNYGEVLATRRKEVFLATKTGDRSYDGALRGVEASLKRLRIDRVDLLQVHGVSAKEDFAGWDKPGGVMKALRKLREERVTRFIGGPAWRRRCRAIERSISTRSDHSIPPPDACHFSNCSLRGRHGILAMKIMGSGFGSLAVGNPIKNDLDKFWYHDQAPRQAEAGTLIRYALGLGVSAAIVGMGSLEQLRVNVAAVSDGQPLDEVQRKELEIHMA